MVCYNLIRSSAGLTVSESTTEETSNLELIIGFVAESAISSVKRINTDDDIGLWYHQVRSQPPLSELGHQLISRFSALQNLRQAQSLRLQPQFDQEAAQEAG